MSSTNGTRSPLFPPPMPLEVGQAPQMGRSPGRLAGNATAGQKILAVRAFFTMNNARGRRVRSSGAAVPATAADA